MPIADRADDVLEQLVHQFADPFAFWRELIQNAIDAGSNRIECTVRFRPSGEGASGYRGVCTARVQDWGDGMTRDTIEQYLLTKFRSSKEDDLTKIGKFGIGFMSVFACAPELVVVETGRDGQDWRLLMHPDRTWELLKNPEPVEGTRVDIHVEMPTGQFGEFARKSREAVKRWCRHSESGVGFSAGGADGSPPGPAEPVREPLVVNAPFQVEHREEGTLVVAGPSRENPPRSGFYNRGLTLLESEEELFPGVAFKIVSRWLEHTLTRDNVRRDRNFDKAMKIVRKLVEGPMREQLAVELKKAAGAGSDDLPVLLRYAVGQLRPEQVFFPLAQGGVVDGKTLARSASKVTGLYAAAGPDPLVEALTRQGVMVVSQKVAALAGSFLDREAVPAHKVWSLAVPGGSDPIAEALAVRLVELLQPLKLRPERVVLATLFGPAAEGLLVDCAEPGRPFRAEVEKSPFDRKFGKVLCLNRAANEVRVALRAAPSSPELAALMLARLIAVRHQKLDERADKLLTDSALDRVVPPAGA